MAEYNRGGLPKGILPPEEESELLSGSRISVRLLKILFNPQSAMRIGKVNSKKNRAGWPGFK
jgi:hypothetical protein